MYTFRICFDNIISMKVFGNLRMNPDVPTSSSAGIPLERSEHRDFAVSELKL
jgi:hypothetical protein